jgi:hypothetical protein
MKHVLYIGQPYDPLEQLDVQNRKKVGITASTQLLPNREGQLKRDAGTIMPFGYVVVRAWEFEEPVAAKVEKIIHNIRQPYVGEWIVDEDLSLVDAVTDIIENLKYKSKEIDLGEYKETKEFKKAKQSNSWSKLERELYEKIGEREVVTDAMSLKEASGVLKEDGYYVNDVRYSTIGQACRRIVGGSTRCYDAFKIDGVSIIDKMKEHNIEVI